MRLRLLLTVLLSARKCCGCCSCWRGCGFCVVDVVILFAVVDDVGVAGGVDPFLHTWL